MSAESDDLRVQIMFWRWQIDRIIGYFRRRRVILRLTDSLLIIARAAGDPSDNFVAMTKLD